MPVPPEEALTRLPSVSLIGKRRNRNLLIKSLSAVLAAALCVALWAAPAFALEPGFQQYTDPGARFTFEYPATMKVEAPTPDDVRISHLKAGIRIRVFVENRQRKTPLRAEELLKAFKQKLSEEMTDVKFLDDGKLAGLAGSQAYVICSFKNKKGLQLVQLVQYYVAQERILQMIISDVPEGFKNLLKVIRTIHQSLRILKPELK